MMMPVVGEVTTIIELEQLVDDDHVPCRCGEVDDCDVSARWAVRCPSCGLDWTACDHHRMYLDNSGATGYFCSRPHGCHALSLPVPLPWRPI